MLELVYDDDYEENNGEDHCASRSEDGDDCHCGESGGNGRSESGVINSFSSEEYFINRI